MRSAVRFAEEETLIGPTWVVIEHVSAVHEAEINVEGARSHVCVGQHVLRLKLEPDEVMSRLGFVNGGG